MNVKLKNVVTIGILLFTTIIIVISLKKMADCNYIFILTIIAGLLAIAVILLALENKRRERAEERLAAIEASLDGIAVLNNRMEFRDIGICKQAEAAFAGARKRAEESEKMASLGYAAAGMAHEICQPLNTIKIISDGILYWYEKGITPETAELMAEINAISAQADRIDAIVRRLRQFNNDRASSAPVLCSVNQAVERVVERLEHVLSFLGIKAIKELAETDPAILGNMDKLEEVLANLLLNAIQEFENLDSSDKVIFIHTFQGEKITIEIMDNAGGIPGKHIKRIFDPFFTTREPGFGMGLGLSIVNSIVTYYNGSVSVENNEIGGATFRVDFPVPLF